MLLLAMLPCPMPVRAQFLDVTQIAGSATPTAGQTVAAETVTVHGVVLNANTKQPIARVLVQAGSHSMLTEHDGRFEFTDMSGSSSSLRLTKPGFYQGLDSNTRSTPITFGATADPVTMYLYPEGLITGSVTAADGEPLGGIYLQALRRSGDESGPTWSVAGQTVTNGDGQFRLPVGPGSYVLETHYTFDRPVRQKAVLPMLVPAIANGAGAGAQPTIDVESGTEQHLDVRAEVRSVHEVHIRFDGALNQSFPAIEAHLSNGLSFFPNSRPSGTPGEFSTTLPSGSYTLTVSTNERDGPSYAETAVMVGDGDVSGVLLQTLRSVAMPVEVVADSSAAAATSDNQPPSVQQLGLRFVRTDRSAPTTNESVYLRANRGEVGTFSFVPGRYRLLAQPVSHWFIESATVGGTDLLTQEIDVEAGGSSAPLRIVVSNNTAGIKGTVRLDGSPGVGCWVYLVATPPGVTPVIFAVSGSDGSFSQASVPPGSYRAVAFEAHPSDDFSDAATLTRLAPYMKSVTIAPGEVGRLELDAIPTLELKR